MDIVCFSSVVKWDFPVHLQSATKMQPILGTLRQAVSQRWFLLDSAEVWSLNCWRILSQSPAAASCWDPWVLDKKNHKVRQESCLFQHLTYEHSSNYDWIYSWMLSWETHGLYNQMHLLPARLKSSMMWCGCLRIFFQVSWAASSHHFLLQLRLKPFEHELLAGFNFQSVSCMLQALQCTSTATMNCKYFYLLHLLTMITPISS